MFTIGNAIVLGVVVVILAVYRQLDMNNRSLEKVRRYSDKAREDLDRIVAQKATEIRDMSVEVDVHQKSAVEVLKRLSASEQNLNSRSEQFESFSRRIQEYDSALHELLDMTKRAEENIGRIRDESEYVDTVGKRIKNTAGQLEQLEKRIPRIIEEFSVSNQEQLENSRKQLVISTEQQLDQFGQTTGHLQQRLDSFQEYMAALEQSGENLGAEIQLSLKDIYEQLTHEAESLSEQRQAEFSNAIDSKIDQATSAVETIQDHADSVVRTATERVTALKNQGTATIDEVASRLQECEADYQQRLELVAERGERLETSALTKLRDKIQHDVVTAKNELQASVQGIAEHIEGEHVRLNAEIGVIGADLGQRQESLVQSCDQFLLGLESRYQRDSQGIDEKISNLREKLIETEHEAERYAGSVNEELDRIVRESNSRIEAAFTALQEELSAKDAAFNEQLQLGEERGKSTVETVVRKLSQTVDAETEILRNGMEQKIEHLQSAAESQYERIDSMFTSMKTEVEEWIGGTREYIGELDTHESQLKERILNLESRITATDSQVKEQLSLITSQLEHEQSAFGEMISATQNELNQHIHEVKAGAEDSIEQLSQQIESEAGTVSEKLSSMEAEINLSITSSYEKLYYSIAESESKLEPRIIDLDQRIKKETSELSQKLTAGVEKISQQATDTSSALSTDLQNKLQELRVDMGQQYSSFAEDIESNSNYLEKQSEDLRNSIQSVYQNMYNELHDQIINTRSSAQAELEMLEHNLLAGIERRLTETEGAVRTKVEHIHAVADDIDQIEQHMRDLMQNSADNVMQEINRIGQAMIDQRKIDLESSAADMQRVRSEVTELEQDLDALKEQAYENVQAKLKVFENDFFSDLRTRSDAMEQQLEQWQDSVRTAIDQCRTEHNDERSRIEENYTANLRQKVAELQARGTQQYERALEQIIELERNIVQRHTGIETNMVTIENTIQNELNELNQRSAVQFTQELRKHDDEMVAQLRDFEKTVQSELRNVTGEVQSSQDTVRSLVEQTRSDVTLWQTEVLQKLSSAEKDVDSDIAGFKLEVGNTIASIQEDFLRQREELITRTEQERSELKQQMERMFSQSADLEDRLDSEIKSALDTFALRYEQYQAELQTAMKEREKGVDTRIRDFRGLLQETRDQFESMEEKLFGKLDDRANLLAMNINEIEKRQKAFIDQTKIFERADSLKLGLQESIEDLKADLQRVENQRKELREMETQFQRLKKLGDEAIDKMGRFTQEKGRIDQLELDYQELMRLSQAVDSQVETLQYSHDSMQAIQLKLRNLEELQSSVDEKFQRMKTKEEVISNTSKAIDTSFIRIQEIEGTIQGIDSELSLVPRKIDGVFAMIQEIQQDKSSIEHVVSQMGNLNDMLQDVEKRIEKMQQAREWLARTETRFEEINRSADEQLRMLGSLLKEQGSDNKRKGKDVPTVQERDTVIKLSRNGWHVEEIAKATKLSPGEVELILEIAHK